MKNHFTKFVLLISVFSTFGAGSRVWADPYTDKTIHDPGHKPEYKHSGKSFTSPFDYAPCEEQAPRPIKPQQIKQANHCNQFTFDAAKSYDVDKQKLVVSWDFGDGQTSNQPTVTHTYEKAGEYDVVLTVRDSSGLECDSSVASTKVRANHPPVVNAGPPVKACLGDSVSFDASRTQASAPGKYWWDFGDGTTGEGIFVTHAYQKPGNYRVTLKVDDGLGTPCSWGTGATTAEIGDKASLTFSGPVSVCTGKNAVFTAQTNSRAKLHWDFGDGSTWDGGATANHVYQKGGTYNVTVTSDNGQGFACSVAASSAVINVNSAPIANAGKNLVCCVNKEAEFDASGSSDADSGLLTYHWDFGDGETGQGARTTHAYQQNGTYRVVLTVKDGSGSECGTAQASFVANVNARPEAILEVR